MALSERAVEERAPPGERLVVATPVEAAVDGQVRVSWARTLLRLALEPDQHPWSARWRVRRRFELGAVALALLLLLLFALSGCATGPLQTLRDSAPAPRPAASRMRCETVMVSRELQIPADDSVDLGDLRLSIDDIPSAAGTLRVLVRRPRFSALLEGGEFDKVRELPASQQLTIVLQKPRRARSDWPRRDCTACRIDVELTGLFGSEDALDAFFARAAQEARAIDAGFAAQTAQPLPPSPLKQLAEEMIAESKRCGVALEPALHSVLAALQALDAARMQMYGADPDLPDADALEKAWDTAQAAIDAAPAAATAARELRWPSLERLRSVHAHLELAAQLSPLESEEKKIAVRWVALALARDAAAVEKRVALLPQVRDLQDAEARLDWVSPKSGAKVRVPGTPQPAWMKVREWAAARRGRKCIGAGGAAPLANPAVELPLVAGFFGALKIEKPADIAIARETQRRASELLCEPAAADVSPLFAGLADKELGPVADKLEEIFREADPRTENDALAHDVLAQTTRLFCKLFDAQTIKARVESVAGYKIFVEGGTRLFELLPGPLVCNGEFVTPRDARKRLREAYRDALEKHAARDRLCPLRGGRCPEEVAASVRRIFGLSKPQLAAAAREGSKLLDFPPPFGFSEEWVQKIDRCARDACDALQRLHDSAPMGEFDGALCPPRAEGVQLPTEVTLANPDSPSSITLAGCEALAGVRLTLHRAADAGTLVSIASNHQFRYGSENVTRQERHPQLGRIYERVADLTDPGDVSRRSDGAYEVAVTPTVENQTFFFITLRRRDY